MMHEPDAFDILRAEAAAADAHGVEIREIATDEDFRASLKDLDGRCERTRHRLGEVDLQLMNLFDQRFGRFAEPMTPSDASRALCEHHEQVQKTKSASGKRAWFDRIGPERIYMRHAYRISRQPIAPDLYVHDWITSQHA